MQDAPGASAPKYKTLNVDLATWQMLKELAEAEDRPIVAIARRALAAYTAERPGAAGTEASQ